MGFMRPVAGALAAPATVMGATLMLASCAGGHPGTLGQQVQSWARATGLTSALHTLEDDARRVRVVAAGADGAGLRTVCDVLVTDALSANQELPSPDAELNSILTAAYRAAVAAGDGCLRGARARRGLSSQVTGDLARAQAQYVKAQARVDLLEPPGGSP